MPTADVQDSKCLQGVSGGTALSQELFPGFAQ